MVNMNKLNQLKKAKTLLEQAKSLLDQAGLQETTHYVKKVIQNINVNCERYSAKKNFKNEQFKNWWGNIEAGTANLGLSKLSQTNQKSLLDKINNLIGEQQSKIDGMRDQEKSSDVDLLQE